jgi:hypothetical protein
MTSPARSFTGSICSITDVREPSGRSITPSAPCTGGAGLEDVGHRRRFAGDPPAVEVPPVRAAEALAVIADTRGAAPQLGGLAVEPEDAPAGIAGVGSDGQDLQDARRCVGQGPRIHGLADGRRSQGSNSLVHQPLPVVLGASGRLVMPLGAGFQASIQHSRMGRNSLVQGTRSSHTCAASAVATFGFQSGTRIMELLASFLLRSSHQRAPQGVANFGIGALARPPRPMPQLPDCCHNN